MTTTKTPRFLLVEDDPLLQSMYSLKSKNMGLDLRVLPNADGDFIKIVTEINPDAVLMDISFEGSKNNGVVAAEALLTDKRTKNLPVIFFTNADKKELAQRAQKLSSCIGFLVKAVYTPNQILKKVQELYSDFLEHKKV